MAYEVTANTSVAAQLLPKIDQLSQSNQPLVKQVIAARLGVVGLAAAAVFDALLHTVAVIVRAPVAAVKFAFNGLPNVKIVNRVNYQLSGFASMSDVRAHALRVAKFAPQALAIGASFLNPRLALPLHQRLGMIKPQAQSVISLASLKNKAWNVISSRAGKAAILGLLLCGAVAGGAYRFDLVNKLSAIDFKSLVLRKDYHKPVESSTFGSWVTFGLGLGVLALASVGVANSRSPKKTEVSAAT